jgi:hypothetical protein
MHTLHVVALGRLLLLNRLRRKRNAILITTRVRRARHPNTIPPTNSPRTRLKLNSAIRRIEHHVALLINNKRTALLVRANRRHPSSPPEVALGHSRAVDDGLLGRIGRVQVEVAV